MNVRTESDGAESDHPAPRGPAQGRQDHDGEPGLRLLAAESGVGGDHQRRRFEIEFRDEGRTCIVLGGGPSVSQFPVECFRHWPCIAINDGYRLAPGAQAIWAADAHWWGHHIEFISEAGFRGRRFGSDATQCRRLGLEHRYVEHREGLSHDWQTLRAGGNIGNSGAQAMNLAYLAGARRLLLFGFDMQKDGQRDHWFGDHPKYVGRQSPYPAFIRGMAQMASDLIGAGVSVLNCSPRSALPYFQRLSVAQAIALCAPT